MWKKEFLFYSGIEEPNFPFVVLANKCDIDPADVVVTADEAKRWCSENGGYVHMDTSAKTFKNVEFCFETAVRKITQVNNGGVSISNLTSGTPSVNLKTMAAEKKSDGCC